MIIMALDHVRDFFNYEAMQFSPTNLEKTNAVLFLTRWITHICAPTFMFTAGLGTYFFLRRPGRTTSELSWFLLKRGIWLLVLEQTVFRLGLFLSLTGSPLFWITLSALGCAMIALAAFIHLPIRVLAWISIAGIALHNLADPVQAASLGAWAPLWNLLHQPGVIQGPGFLLIVGYPVIPWIFVMTAGYCFGEVASFSAERRQRWLVRLGAAMCIAFVAIRGLNIYGDPVPWSDRVPGTALLSFLNATKNPPSLDYLLMTLGPALLVWAALEKFPNMSARNPMIVFGRVPMFYFIGHFLMAHLLLFPFTWLRYGRTDFLWTPLPTLGGGKNYPPGFGYSIGQTYGIWLLVLVMMYPLCIWFGRLKDKRSNQWPWLRYI
jgi:uncharacterized membrane protein